MMNDILYCCTMTDRSELPDVTPELLSAFWNDISSWKDEETKVTRHTLYFQDEAACREAMKQLRASRSGVLGWLWKVIFNRAQNRQEKEYLQDLNDKISEFNNEHYKIEEKVAELTGKTVFGKKLTEEQRLRRPRGYRFHLSQEAKDKISLSK